MTGEHDFSSVEFVDGTSSTPEVHAELVLQAKDDFRGSVKSERKLYKLNK